MAAEGCEDHCDTESDEAQAADTCYDVVAKETVKLGLQGSVILVEDVLLVQGELEFHFGHSFKAQSHSEGWQYRSLVWTASLT